ncbi:ATP-binding protein [Aggregatilinea lenta]|uniref:ATP-binding protein n=1 Tax=Aggregatilinea lenta TaxID=913108 RepID=UPI000E5AFB5B|nr:ATP-binding protein [Aggregatilinea lenta]
MQEQEILDLLESGRSETVEWLPGRAPVDEIATTMAAMANARGGTLVLGVTSRTNKPGGIDDPEGVSDRVLAAALAIQPPLIIPLPDVIKVKGAVMMAVQVPRGMPHVYAVDGRYLTRVGERNEPLAPLTMRRLLFERGDVSFESLPVRGARKEDLDWDQVVAYTSMLTGMGGISPDLALIKRGCLVRQEGKLYPTNAGMLLFGRDPQQFLRGSEITAARFAGKEMGDVFLRQDINGPLPQQIRRVETFLIDSMRKGVQLSGNMARSEEFEYPLQAVRELVVNAVAHRDYSIHGDGIRLYLFSDRLEITSPGGLPGPVTIDNIVDERFSRNTAIVQVLSDMGFIERLGYGVDRVLALVNEYHLPRPVFTETAGGFRVSLYNRPGAVEDDAAEPQLFGGVFRGQSINRRQEYALDFLINQKNPRITNKDLQELCPDVHSETLRRDFADLVSRGILVKMGEKRGSYYVLKRQS